MKKEERGSNATHTPFFFVLAENQAKNARSPSRARAPAAMQTQSHLIKRRIKRREHTHSHVTACPPPR